MTFQQFKELGFEITESEALKLEKLIVQLYRDAVKTIRTEIEKAYAPLAGIPKDQYYTELLKYNRSDKLIYNVSSIFNKASNDATKIIQTQSSLSISNAYYRQLYANQWISSQRFMLLPENIVELSVYGTNDAWTKYIKQKKLVDMFGNPINYKAPYATITDLMLKNKKVELQAIQSAITNGLISGNGARQVARSIKDIIGSYTVVDGQITSSGALANAMRISRTEINRTMNDAAYAAQKSAEAQGMDIQKMWVATLDGKTRPVHGRLDGQKQPVDAPFKAGGFEVQRPGRFGIAAQDVNCRCTTVDIIDGQSPKIRRGRIPQVDENGKLVPGENSVFEYKTFDTWIEENGLKYNKNGILVKG